MKRLVLAAAVLGLSAVCMGQDMDLPSLPKSTPKTTPHHPKTTPLTHPNLPADGSWSGPLVLLILGVFASAIPVGLIVRSMPQPEEAPAAHGDDHGHGHGHDAHGH